MGSNDHVPQPVTFDRHPDTYRHWSLEIAGPIATLTMNVDEKGSHGGDIDLVLNSYDIGVDVELADAIRRLRFEHPSVRCVVLTSTRDRIFCAGANIRVLASSTHGRKVNFCKFTNETRLEIEDASTHSGITFIAALNGTASGGGYELALACDEIMLVDDRSSAISLPEVPLLGVLPGTGGLTRLVDKRKVRRDRADVFSTLAEGIRGKRAVKWGLVDATAPPSRFREAVQARAEEIAQRESDKTRTTQGLRLDSLSPSLDENVWRYEWVEVKLEPEARTVTLTLTVPSGAPASADLSSATSAGAEWWPFKAFRELDDAICRLRFNAPELGTWLIETRGSVADALAFDAILETHSEDWFVHEVRHFIKRTLKRLETSARSIFALIDAGSCFAGTLYEFALAADRIYMLDDPDGGVTIALSPLNRDAYPMANGLSRLETRFLGEPEAIPAALEVIGEVLETPDADDLGLLTDAPDDLDWDDTIRIAIEERASLSPDAPTGMEANLRFAGPETLETKIFGRLSAWQNWIFQRPNAVGPDGALSLYGHPKRPVFDWQRT